MVEGEVKSTRVKMGYGDGAGVWAQLRDLSLASDLALPGPKPRWCLSQLPREESGVLWGGQVWAEMCVAAIMSGQSLKGLTIGQNMCRKASLALWLVCARLQLECRESVCSWVGGAKLLSLD